MAGVQEHAERLQRALEAVKTALEGIRNESDPEAAFLIATDLQEALRQQVIELAELRKQRAIALMETEGLSLSQAGERLGLSKPRMQKLVD